MAVVDFPKQFENQYLKITSGDGFAHRSHPIFDIGVELLFRCVVIQAREGIFKSQHHAVNVNLRFLTGQLGLVVRFGRKEGRFQSERCHRVNGFRVFRDADTNARLLNLLIKVSDRAQSVASMDFFTRFEESCGTNTANPDGFPIGSLYSDSQACVMDFLLCHVVPFEEKQGILLIVACLLGKTD